MAVKGGVDVQRRRTRALTVWPTRRRVEEPSVTGRSAAALARGIASFSTATSLGASSPTTRAVWVE
jgi:hypothetical protein